MLRKASKAISKICDSLEEIFFERIYNQNNFVPSQIQPDLSSWRASKGCHESWLSWMASSDVLQGI